MDNEFYQQRREKAEALRREGVFPYGGKFACSQGIKALRDEFVLDKAVSVAGRVVAMRRHGKAGFLDIRDRDEKIQVYLRPGDLSRGAEVAKFLDVGDIIGVRGETFRTRTDEPTIKAQELVMLAKSLRVLPEKWHGLKDVEIRYRQRYLDLIANSRAKEIFILRSKVITAIRDFLNRRGFLEVETPMLQFIPGGAAGRPFETYHNVFDSRMFLRIAPELYLKRLLVGGMERVYEINKSFRNEGVSTRHNPEFTMLEAYAAYGDYRDMMNLVREIIVHVGGALGLGEKIEYQGNTIDLGGEWAERSFADAVRERFGILPEDTTEEMVKKLAARGRKVDAKLSRSQVVRIVEDLLQEEGASSPVFLTDYFSALCPLAKNKKDNPYISERFELFIGGMEVANAYSELNDPLEQKQRFLRELKDNCPGGEKCVAAADDRGRIDRDFVRALEYGMPPAGGLGVGIDRLVMLFANQPSIREVILFPHLKPECSMLQK
ncbi:MAG: lysine--tRNA ligase [Candidatus Omnitrophota bacterium]